MQHIWLRVSALAIVVLTLGLRVLDLWAYTLLIIAAVIVFSGAMRTARWRWIAAIAIALVTLGFRALLAPPQIEEGHNLYLPGPQAALQDAQLPADVVTFLKAEFDRVHPPQNRCAVGSNGCWQSGSAPNAVFAFSGDGIFSRTTMSRTVTGIDFNEAVYNRLGFTNDSRHNWYDQTDIERAVRDRQFWKGYDRWHLTMPWYAVYRFPSGLSGSDLCWRGDMLWEGEGERFETIRHADKTCRTLTRADIGRRIVAVEMTPQTLAVTLHPPLLVSMVKALRAAITFTAFAAILLVLVRWSWRDTLRPFTLIALALTIICIDDASLIGGFRPFDGGDDGLFYTGVGRIIAEHVANGNIKAALIGGEPVYYYGGPLLRYIRALEAFWVGDSNLVYLSLLLALPFVVLGLFRRFLPQVYAWPLAVIFTALPLGEIFGTSFFHYVRWTGRGFADPAAHLFVLAGVLVLAGPRGTPWRLSPPHFAWGSFLMALAVFVKPIIAALVGIVLGGIGLWLLYQRDWRRLIPLCLGFTPVLLMPLHNIIFGGQFVLFSSNTNLPETYTMPPSAYLAALQELVHFDWRGEHMLMWRRQWSWWLAGPGARQFTIPLHMIAVGMLVYAVIRARTLDPWLRLLAAAALAEHAVSLIYIPTPRYFYSTWFITALVTGALLVQWIGEERLRRYLPLRDERHALAR